MKKLLALILCVMLFVSVIPTAAFAAGTTGGVAWTSGATAAKPAWKDTAVSKKTISDLNKDIKAIYYAMAADDAVFATAKTMYALSDGIAAGLLEGVDNKTFTWYDDQGVQPSVTLYHDDMVDNVRAYLNANIGNEITNYINKRAGLWTDSAGHVKPEAYLKVFADAATKAVSSEKAQKGIEALATALFAIKVQGNANDHADDLYTAIKEWGNDKMAEFGWEWIATDPSVPDYFTGWLPEYDVLVPTGSQATSADAAEGYTALLGNWTWTAS